MEELIFLASFIFSFFLFIIGVFKESFILSISGSILLLILSLILVSVGIASEDVRTLHLNVTNSSGHVVAEDVYTVRSSLLMNNPMTYIFGFTIGIFATFFILYSVWQFIKARRQTEVE